MDRSKGGIILKYKLRSLDLYRLCQTRVFAQGSSFEEQRVERSCKTNGVQSLKIFDYNDYLSDIQKNTYQNVSHGVVWLKIGSEDVKISIKSTACEAIYQAVFKTPVDMEGMMSIEQSIDKLELDD